MTTLPLSRPAPGRTAAPPARGRSLTAYLLVPRPKDLVKAVVLPLSFVVASLTQRDVSAEAAGRAVLVWIALELLVYQSRYQWNDIRGFDADQAHPQSADRGRLPGPVEKGPSHKAASAVVALGKLLLTAALAIAVPGVAGVLLAMTAGVFGVAVVYERLRTAATGHTAQVPVPLRPALVALWVFVGSGYAVRALTGLALAVDLPASPALTVAAGLCAWALGVVFVTCRWALEALCFGRVEGRRLVWRVRPDQAREHTLGLVRWLPEDAPAAGTPATWRALQGRTPLSAPWNLALVVAGAAAAVSGALLDSSPTLLAGLTGGAAALGIALTPGSRLLTAALGVVVLSVGLGAAGAHHPVLATLPWLTAVALYCCFTHQCAAEIGHPLRRLSPPRT